MNKILLIGSSGLLGLNLKSYLKFKKMKVLNFKRTSKKNFIHKNFCKEFFYKNKFSIIINLSAITDIDYCEKNKIGAKKVNFMITKNIVDEIIRNKHKTFFIFLSTDQFYNKFKSNYENKTVIKNYYAKTKHLSEKYLKKIPSVSIRTNFFGLSLNLKKRYSFSDFIFFNLKKKNKINLADDILFSPISINSLNKIIYLCCKKKISGIYNVGSKKGISKYKFGIKFAKKFKLNLDLINRVMYKDLKFKAERPKDMRMKLNLFEKKYRYKFPNLENELKKVVNEYKK